MCYSLISTMKDRILKRFNEEIAVLERELKVDLPKEIQRARELGDLRENAEYKAAKERDRDASVSAYQRMVAACFACHSAYRERVAAIFGETR